MKNPKEFWESQHGKKNPYWLTGSSFDLYCKHHQTDRPRNKTVLEVGVGQGHATREMARTNYIYAVDISQTALDALPQIGKRLLTPDMVKIPSDSVDFAICHLVFQHCEDDAVEFILKQSIRALKPSGRFYLQSGIAGALTTKHQDMTDKGQLVWRSKEKLDKMIADVGGKIVSNRVVKMTQDIDWQLLKITKNI